MAPSTADFFANTNWSLLRRQKHALMNLLDESTEGNVYYSLNGLVSLLDSMQDFAVDQLGIPSTTVFPEVTADDGSLIKALEDAGLTEE